jgi:predicted Zn-dependent peptidase
MKIRSLFQKSFTFLACLMVLSSHAFSQRPGSQIPREEKLLNGLKLLMWNDPSAPDVKISIRIHSGAAFDPQGKEGVMKLLSENIFPTQLARDYFVEDLEGSVDVISNYDFIQVNVSGKSSDFVRLIETVAQAVSNVSIDKETTAALKKSLTEKLAVMEKDPAYILERATAKRLFGTFPYGRPPMGSVESLERIDFADLQFAKERFLSADNATVAITGNFSGDLGYRAARRFFGAWLKSDKRVPSTFRQPDAPDTKTLEISIAGALPQSSFALRGLAKNDPDFFASVVLENILKARSAKAGGSAIVSHDARVLPGVFLVKQSGSAPFPFSLFSERVSESEFTRARDAAVSEFAKRPITERYLDADTYRITAVGDSTAFAKVTLADVQRVADRLAKNPIVSVVTTSSVAAQ